MSIQRRNFIKHLSAGALASFAFPAFGLKYNPSPLPVATDLNDEKYWSMVKNQFAVPGNLVMVNAANLCPTTYAVNEKVVEFTQALGRDVSFQYREIFTELRKKSIAMLSEFVGVDQDEIGITRNTSESNCMVIQGLDFKAGDEVIIWEQNHPSNNAVWFNKAKRFGFTVKKVSLPANPKSVNDLIDPFIKAITPKTRLISFSHISNSSGIAMPAREICQLAKSKGILTLVDGAQALGFLDLNLHDLGCSFYSASTHKWLMGPFENGILYVSKENIQKVWPNVIGGGWKESKTVDENICVLGQRNEATTAALPDAFTFHNSIGKEAIHQRVVDLNTYLKKQIQLKLTNAEFITPLSPELSGGIVIINLPGKDSKEIYEKLYSEYGIAGATTGGIRFSPHIYNTKSDLDKIVDALVKLAA